MKTEICENCGAEISGDKQAFIHNSHILCEKCYGELKKEAQDSPTTKNSVWDKTVSEAWPYIVFALILCAIGGLIVAFFVGRTYSKYETHNSFYRKTNSIFSGADKETSPADIDPRAKRILSVGSIWRPGSTSRLDIQLTNISGKDIKSVLGYVLIFDQFGQRLKTLKAPCDEPMLAGETIVESWWINVESELRMLRLLRSGQVEAQFVAQQVIYADGTRDKFRAVQGLEKFRY